MPNVLSIFSGGGGIDCGFKKAGFEICFSTDFWQPACDTLKKNKVAYYGEFVQKTYLAVPGLVERLDLIDPSPENYWSRTLPDIEKRIQALPCNQEQNLIEEGAEDDG